MIDYFKNIIGGFFSLLLGMTVTLKYLFKKPVTIQYPDEHRFIEPNYRGILRLTVNAEGKIRCIACKLCQQACPNQTIARIVPETGPDGKKRPREFILDHSLCLFCYMCVEACPWDAITHTVEHEITVYDRQNLVFDQPTLLAKNVIK